MKVFNPPIQGHEDHSTGIYSTVFCIKAIKPPTKGHEDPSA
jgi:hypothetical protein